MSARITFTGNATSDAELRFSNSGTAFTNVTVAVTPRVKQPDGTWGDGDAAFYRVTCFGSLAENAAESITRGMRVNVDGILKPREFEHNGEKRMSLDVTADEIGPSLRFATATVTKAQRGGQQSGGWGQPAPTQQTSDPWANQPAGNPGGSLPAGIHGEEPPFQR